MSEQGSFDWDAKDGRDLALEIVLLHNENWADRAMLKILELPTDWEFTGEELRLRLTPEIGKPKHYNAWGALCMRAVREKLIVASGAYRHMETTKSHGRKTPTYKRNTGQPSPGRSGDNHGN